VRARFLAAMVAGLAASCGGKPEPAVATDPVLERQTSAGRAALLLEKPEQAVKQYSDALTRARERDDPGAIGDLAFNLAVAQLRAREPEAALRNVQEASAELARRHMTVPPSLALAEAVALYRTGRSAEADAIAMRLEGENDPEVTARAAFIRGLIADAKGDLPGLRLAHANIGAAKSEEARADESELAARLLLRDDPSRARAEAERAAALRREFVDYRGLSRCLGLAALAAERAGELPSAADLYLRAGRSAAGQAENTMAAEWLKRAITLSRDPAISGAARVALGSLSKER
jgi:hypothetical protein